jgi:predicted ATPase
VRDPAAVAEAVAAVFEASPRAGQTVQQAVVEFLRTKELLLVLDNCEHLLGPVSTLVGALERACPRLAVLATSREGLGIEGERMLAVPSLAAPDEGADVDAVVSSDAVRLFVERAQAVKAEFVLTAANGGAVAQVCRRLDGVPLAIELAAARVPAMNPAELARRLDRRFEVLAGGRRGAVERHQTLRAAIDWSYELLDDPQRRLLARLSIFAGGCTLEAAEVVCAGDVIDEGAVWALLATLVGQSLVVAEDQGLDTRYRLLETIRQYGEERLDEHGETAELRSCHAEYYAALAAALFERFFTPDQMASATRLSLEQENVLRALNWAVDTSNVDLAFRMLRSVPFATAQLGSGFSLPSEPALALPGAADHPEYPVALTNAAAKAAFRGDLQAAEQWCEEALAAEDRLQTHPEGRVAQYVAAVRGSVAVSAGAWPDAALFYERAGDMAKSAGHTAQAASHVCSVAQCKVMSGDPDTAVPFALEGLALARKAGAPSGIAQGLSALANALADRDPERARRLLRESLDVGAQHYEAAGQIVQATLVAAHLGDQRLTLELAARVIPRLSWIGERPQLAGIFNVVAWASAAADPDGAAVLQGASRRLALSVMEGRDLSRIPPATSSATGASTGLITELRRETTRSLTETLGQEQLRELRDQGELMDTDGAVRLAMALIERAVQSS